MILLYPQNETDFADNGLGALSDAISCTVTEEANGQYEAQLEYPVTGVHYSEIKNRCILFAKPDPYRDAQPFRIYQISKPLSGIVTVFARHISYDLSGIPVSPFTAASVTGAFAQFESQAVGTNPFTFWTDKTTQAAFSVEVPSSIRSLLGGTEGSVLDVFGGEYEFDRWTVKLFNRRGADNGVVIRYGKNLIDLQQEENIANVATGIYPFWRDAGESGILVQLPEKTVNAPGSYDFERVIPVDFSSDFSQQPTEEQLRTRAQAYVTNNNIGVPTVSLSVSFQPLDQTEEYQHLALLERVSLFDTVTVEYPALGVSAKAKCIETVYDVLKGRYVSISLGDARANIADTIVNQQKQIDNTPTESFMQKAIRSLTSSILGANGGSVRLLDTNGDGEPDTLYIADNPDPAQAQKVWRFNYQGWGASENGYNGPFTLGASFDAGIIADFITAGTFNGNLIKVGRIQSHDGEVYFDLDKSELAASILRGAGNDNKTIARIGRIAWAGGAYGQGFVLEYPESGGGQLIITLDGITPYQPAKKTEFTAGGDILIRSNNAGSNGANNNSIKLEKDAAQGQGTIEIHRADREGTVLVFHADQTNTEVGYTSADGKRTWVNLTADRISFGTAGQERGSLDADGWHGWTS